MRCGNEELRQEVEDLKTTVRANARATEEVLVICRQLQAMVTQTPNESHAGDRRRKVPRKDDDEEDGNDTVNTTGADPIVTIVKVTPSRPPAPIIFAHFETLKDQQMSVMLRQYITQGLHMKRYTDGTPQTVRTKINKVCEFSLLYCATKKQREVLHFFRDNPCTTSDPAVLNACNAVLDDVCMSVVKLVMAKVLLLESQLRGGVPPRASDHLALVNTVAKRLGHLNKNKINLQQSFSQPAPTPAPVARTADWQYSLEGRRDATLKKHESIFKEWRRSL